MKAVVSAAPGGDHAGIQVGRQDLAPVVIIPVGDVDAQAAQIRGVLGLGVIAGEHDRVGFLPTARTWCMVSGWSFQPGTIGRQ